MATVTRRRQRPVKGGRARLSPYVLHVIEEHVQDDAREHQCYPSFVVSTILAKHYGITDQPDYRIPERAQRRKRKR